jgi:hypothetical protein
VANPQTNQRRMESSETPNITQLLVAWNQGDQDALAQLTPLVYRELHRLAHAYLAGERSLRSLD